MKLLPPKWVVAFLVAMGMTVGLLLIEASLEVHERIMVFFAILAFILLGTVLLLRDLKRRDDLEEREEAMRTTKGKWLEHTVPADSPKASCWCTGKPPLHDVASKKWLATPGDRWQCNRCGKIWTVFKDRHARFPHHDNLPVLSWRYTQAFEMRSGKPPKGKSGVSRP